MAGDFLLSRVETGKHTLHPTSALVRTAWNLCDFSTRFFLLVLTRDFLMVLNFAPKGKSFSVRRQLSYTSFPESLTDHQCSQPFIKASLWGTHWTVSKDEIVAFRVQITWQEAGRKKVDGVCYSITAYFTFPPPYSLCVIVTTLISPSSLGWILCKEEITSDSSTAMSLEHSTDLRTWQPCVESKWPEIQKRKFEFRPLQKGHWRQRGFWDHYNSSMVHFSMFSLVDLLLLITTKWLPGPWRVRHWHRLAWKTSEYRCDCEGAKEPRSTWVNLGKSNMKTCEMDSGTIVILSVQC